MSFKKLDSHLVETFLFCTFSYYHDASSLSLVGCTTNLILYNDLSFICLCC